MYRKLSFFSLPNSRAEEHVEVFRKEITYAYLWFAYFLCFPICVKDSLKDMKPLPKIIPLRVIQFTQERN